MLNYSDAGCAQAGLGDKVGDGHITECNEDQIFMWNGDDGPIPVAGRPDLGVVFRGVSANVNRDPIILKLCDLVEDRRLPWKV